jgi:hypothetical protein
MTSYVILYDDHNILHPKHRWADGKHPVMNDAGGILAAATCHNKHTASENMSTTKPRTLLSYIGHSPRRARDSGGNARVLVDVLDYSA